MVQCKAIILLITKYKVIIAIIEYKVANLLLNTKLLYYILLDIKLLHSY